MRVSPEQLAVATEELGTFLNEYAGALPWTLMNPLWDIHGRMVSGYPPHAEDQAIILAAMMHVQQVNRYGK